MNTPFLEYELLSPETADPVIMRITGQRERGFRDFTANNRVVIISLIGTNYYRYNSGWKHLCVRGENTGRDFTPINIPLADWSAVKQAIRELNEHYSPVAKAMGDKKEKNMKEDRYEFDLDEWEPYQHYGTKLLILTRKKPKVEDRENIPVKVEYCLHEGYKSTQYGQYHIVQFRVTGEVAETYVKLHPTCGEIDLARKTEFRDNPCKTGYSRITIGVDAREKWSAPVLLPESTYSRLDEITKALEDRANGGKG